MHAHKNIYTMDTHTRITYLQVISLARECSLWDTFYTNCQVEAVIFALDVGGLHVVYIYEMGQFSSLLPLLVFLFVWPIRYSNSINLPNLPITLLHYSEMS